MPIGKTIDNHRLVLIGAGRSEKQKGILEFTKSIHLLGVNYASPKKGTLQSA